MVTIRARVIWALMFLFTLCLVHAAWAGPPTDQLREGVDRVVKILKDQYGVNIVLRALESSAQGGPRLARSTVMGVVFNGLTTMAGFGSLLVAHHRGVWNLGVRGVWNLGVLLLIGSAMTLTASLVVLPTLVHLGGEQPRSSAAHQGPAAAIVPSVAS